MITRLNLKSFSRRLKGCRELDPEEVSLPFGTDREEFDLFLRIMRARTPAEIEDVSKEQVVHMFENAGSFVDTLNSSPFLTDGLMRSLSNKKTVGVRRIL